MNFLALYVFMGQFIDHDITQVSEGEETESEAEEDNVNIEVIHITIQTRLYIHIQHILEKRKVKI